MIVTGNESLSVMKYVVKPNFESKKIRILGENGINSKLKHRKALNSILFGGLVTRTGGDCCRIWES